MIILGIDHGTRKIGLAVSDETELVAAPMPVLKVRNREEALEGVELIAKSVKADQIVLGMPSGHKGEPTEQSELVMEFKVRLEERLGMSIITWDETYSTQRAEFGARGRKLANSDSEAARIILQSYLDYKREIT